MVDGRRQGHGEEGVEWDGVGAGQGVIDGRRRLKIVVFGIVFRERTEEEVGRKEEGRLRNEILKKGLRVTKRKKRKMQRRATRKAIENVRGQDAGIGCSWEWWRKSGGGEGCGEGGGSGARK